MASYKTGSSNIIWSDFPDPDIIRVDDTYYMVSTTMHFFPGCVILRSYNLLDWEFCSYVYDELDNTDGQKLTDNKGIYGKGMWAATLRYHNGTFYVCFVCNDTHKTYCYTSSSITGPWKKSIIPGFYHDMSLLFDDDGKVYVVSGNTNIILTEMEKDLSKAKEGGINKVIIEDDKSKIILGYEGCHFYKINGKYYIFMIHMLKDKMRSEACYYSDKVDGPYTGCDVLHSDLGEWNSGVAQGGIVQTPDGNWFGILFQDHGALGRIPVLVPVNFDEKGFPVFGINNKAAEEVTVLDNRPDYKYKPLFSSDFTDPAWQFNHTPDKKLISLSKRSFSITTDKLSVNVTKAANSLTQRTFTHQCQGTVKVDASGINDGDYAGLCALEGEYGFIAVTKENNQFFLVKAEHKIPYSPWAMNVTDDEKPLFLEKTPLKNGEIQLKMEFNLAKNQQFVQFSFFDDSEKKWVKKGTPTKLKYTLDQFVGVRFTLFCYSTIQAGGTALFTNFDYKLI